MTTRSSILPCTVVVFAWFSQGCATPGTEPAATEDASTNRDQLEEDVWRQDPNHEALADVLPEPAGHEVTPPEAATADPQDVLPVIAASGEFDTGLLHAQLGEVGRVLVTSDPSSMELRFTARAGLALGKTQVYVSRPGGGQTGRILYQKTFPKAVSLARTKVALGSLQVACGDTVNITAYAELVRGDGARSGAWALGTSDTGHEGSSFLYTITCDDQASPRP